MGVLKAWGSVGAAMPPIVACLVLFLLVTGCRTQPTVPELFPALAEFEGREVDRVVFVAPEPFTADSLGRIIETEPTHCSLFGIPLCFPFGLGEQVRVVDVAAVQRDVQRLELQFRRSGFFGTRVVPAIEPSGEDATDVFFVITRGDSILLDTLVITGIEGILDVEEVREQIPLREGELFNLTQFAISADTIQRSLLDLGYANTQVLRNYSVDTVADIATATLQAVPGPQVTIDSILIMGTEELSRRTVLRQLLFEQGDLLRFQELVESQRNLYSLDLVQFATVAVADDTLQLTPQDPSTATVLVQITEGPVHIVEAMVGYGSVECIRTQLRWVSRSFGGGARRLALAGSVSKIGIGEPLRAGFGESFCGAYRRDPLGDVLDYRFTADLTQPWFLSPRNHLTLSLVAERESEPNVFRREAQGGRLIVARRLAPRTVATFSLDAERASVLAAPAVLCAAFLVCLPDDIQELARPRWTNVAGVGWIKERTDRAVDPTDGYIARASLAWAAPWLASDLDFIRGTLEGARYIDLQRERVLALRARFGSVFGTATLQPGDDFLPPDQRFYAGGANSVRGFRRNELGPVVYVAEGPVFDPDNVQSVAVGGTTVGVLNAEYRAPSPFARDLLRIAVFVDAGMLSASQAFPSAQGWRVTPGIGFRASTPIGPVRVDIAYNPYAPTPGPLFLTEPETGTLVRVADRFAPERPSFLERFRLHLAIGQPF